MFYEYAVDPALIDDASVFDFLCEALGRDKGRLLADYPKNRWFSDAHHRIKALRLKDRQHKQCIEYLQFLKKQARLKDRGRRWSDKDSWLENATERQGDTPFAAILTTPENQAEPDRLCRGPKLHSHERWSALNSQRVPRTAEEIVAALMPTLRLARHALLVEPYFTATDARFTDVIKTLAEQLRQEQVNTTLTLITGGDHSVERNNDHLANECRELLPQVLPAGFNLSIEFKHQAFMKTLHDRFLLTDIGGIELGGGFDCRTDGSVLQLTRLSDADLQSITQQIQNSSSLQSFKITGT